MTKSSAEYIKGFTEKDKLGRQFNARFVSIEPGECIYEYDFNPDHTNPNGILHGGALFSIMDSSQGALIHFDLDSKYQAAATGTATIRYLAPVTSGTVTIRTLRKAVDGRKVFIDSVATGPEGSEVARLEEVWICILK